MRSVLIFIGLILATMKIDLYSENSIGCFFDLDIMNTKHVRILRDEGFTDLKRRVLKELQNSWCSCEKANLMMDLIVLTQPDVCVEIGVFDGGSFLPVAALLKFLNQGKIYAIDAWSNEAAIENMRINNPHRDWWSKVDLEGVYRSFRALLRRWKLDPYCHVIRFSSEAAVELIDEIDFLHLDGDCLYK